MNVCSVSAILVRHTSAATNPRRPIEDHVRVGRLDLRAHRQRVGDLEERGGAECLGELGAQAREACVVQEHVALDLARNALDGARVGQPQSLSPLLEGIVQLAQPAGQDAVVRDDARDSLLLGRAGDYELRRCGHGDVVTGCGRWRCGRC